MIRRDVLSGKRMKKSNSFTYHLTSQQISLMSIDVDEDSAYVLLDGTYTVYLNLETGVVEDIQFLSEHGGGNG